MSRDVYAPLSAQTFLLWCRMYGNSPDIINLRFWLEKYHEDVFLTSAAEAAFYKEVQALRRPPEVSNSPDSDNVTNLTERENENDMEPRKRDTKGKPATDTLLKPLEAGTVRAEIIELIMQVGNGKCTINEVLDTFMLDRRALLSHLNMTHKRHGIGYSVTDNVITLAMPGGLTDVFDI